PVSEVAELAKAGTVRALAVTGSQRSKFLPDVPTLRELGLNVANDSWLGVLGPAKMPAEIMRVLSAAIEEVSRSPDMADTLAKFASEPGFQGPEPFAARVK